MVARELSRNCSAVRTCCCATIMETQSPSKSATSLTPTRPRTRSVTSREDYLESGLSLTSMRSQALAFELNFDNMSYVDGTNQLRMFPLLI